MKTEICEGVNVCCSREDGGRGERGKGLQGRLSERL